MITHGPTFCGYCSNRLRTNSVPSKKGAEALAYYHRRRADLQEFLPSCGRNHLRDDFLSFMRELGLPADLSAALPIHVASFLAAKDARGLTQVHDVECPMLGTRASKAEAECACPFRASSSSLSTFRGTLQGLFRDAGLVGDWCPQTGKGNPCVAREVDDYLAGAEREQLQSGVQAKKADLFDESVFNALMDKGWSAWLLVRDSDPVSALAITQDLLMFSILWETGLRMSDALHLLLQDVSPVRESTPFFRGIRLRVNLTKTGKRPKHERVLTLPETSSVNCVPRVWIAFAKAALDCGLPLGTGHLFREVDSSGPMRVWGPVLRRPRLATRFRELATQAGIPVTTTVHSFHPSAAARMRAEGKSKEHICALVDWTAGTYDRYLEGRLPQSLDQVRPLMGKGMGKGTDCRAE